MEFNVKVYSIWPTNVTNSIDLSYLRNGIYIIEIKNEGKTLISKLLKDNLQLFSQKNPSFQTVF